MSDRDPLHRSLPFAAAIRPGHGPAGHRPEHFHELHLDCSLEVCEPRDVKKRYQRARAGAISEFTGVTSPYQRPRPTDLVLATAEQTLEECVLLLHRLVDRQSTEQA